MNTSIIKLILMLLMNFIEGFFSSLKTVIPNSDKTIYWSINETFFIGDDAEIKRDSFTIEYNKLVEKYKKLK